MDVKFVCLVLQLMEDGILFFSWGVMGALIGSQVRINFVLHICSHRLTNESNSEAKTTRKPSCD